MIDQRESALRRWASRETGAGEAARWAAVAGDASSRRYFRLQWRDQSRVCVDAPPATEKNDAFLAVRERLAAAGLPVPELFAADLERGFLLLEDFGDTHLQQVLDAGAPSPDYLGALPLLARIQAVDTAGLQAYDAALLEEEYSRFYQWFCLGWLGLDDDAHSRAVVEGQGELLVKDAVAQPQVLVYRDYHCRNLLLRPDGSLGLIDFQDAVRGPLCYDLASLLRDCYLRWPPDQVKTWALDFRRARLEHGLAAGDSEDEFLRWFDWIGLHRHLKVLGNFTRLALRDGKRRYLADIPLVLDYVEEILRGYSAFTEFAGWWAEVLAPRLADRDWTAAP